MVIIFGNTAQANEEKIKATLVTSTAVLKNNYTLSMDGLTLLDSEIVIDKESLLNEFKELIYLNYLDYKAYKELKERLPIKILVYADRFYIAGKNDKWSQPIFFCYEESGGKLLYFNTTNNEVYYYDQHQNIVKDVIASFGLTSEAKEAFIINKINQYAEVFSRENGVGLKIKIKNNNKGDIDYKVQMSSYNIMDGITFFVIYSKTDYLYTPYGTQKIRQGEVIGYTMDEIQYKE